MSGSLYNKGKPGIAIPWAKKLGPGPSPGTRVFGLWTGRWIEPRVGPDLTLATLLVRPYPIYHDEGEVLKETALTKDNYGSVCRVYVVIEEDNIIKEKYQRWMIENNPTDEVKVIPGSDHMVMISKPQELCSCLQEIVGTYS
ncbi:hypothetical protein HYC85_002457 [Camellia sinensis]|uniref:AB hydrolase-1 domain-containing protein n=1 Tax=Camellia sinensis TaxID=4442 RepID=A0A7J7IAK5_CAMSI|nr:hypothetical protein HYC85_002457 [Camellia sinensis]